MILTFSLRYYFCYEVHSSSVMIGDSKRAEDCSAEGRGEGPQGVIVSRATASCIAERGGATHSPPSLISSADASAAYILALPLALPVTQHDSTSRLTHSCNLFD